MATKAVPLNNRVLSWAMTDMGLSQGALADTSDVSVDKLLQWLEGTAKPSTGEFHKLTNALNRPSSFFFLPEPPSSRPKAVSLRVPYGETGQRELDVNEQNELRKAIRRQKIARWALSELDEYRRVVLPTASGRPEDAAESAQDFLYWNTTEQLRQKSKSAVAKMLRVNLEESGIFVFQASIGEKACRGFSLFDEYVPVIVYNSTKQPASVRSYTMLHELGHLMFSENAACYASNSEHERWCDKFAAAFLMPERHVRKFVAHELGLRAVRPDDVKTVASVSKEFKASYESVALRLFELGIADYELFTTIRSGPAESEFGRSREPQTTPVVRLREFGRSYPSLLLTARDIGKVDDTDVRKYLGVDGKSLSELRRRLEAGI